MLKRRPEDSIGLPLPDLELPSSNGDSLRIRWRVGRSPVVLFFYIHNGTPG